MSADGSSAYELLMRLEAESGRPLSAMLEISDRCNEVCVHCYQVQGQKGELSSADWKRVLDELADAGVLMLTFSGGEASLRADFLELVAHARARGFAVRVFTNGLTMTEALASELARLAVLDVEMSLYATRADIHDFVTGVPGSFERSVRGVQALRRAGVAVTLKALAMSVNQDDLPGFAAFAHSLGAMHRIDTAGIMPREGGDRSPEALTAAACALTELERAAGGLPQTARPHDPGPARRRDVDDKPCHAASEVHVEPNGQVRPCTMLDLDLGSVAGEASTMAAYGSERARSVRALRWGHLHGCRDCDLATFCMRCYASALAETGDALGPYPSACAQARRSYAGAHSDIRIIAHGLRGEALGPYRRVGPGVYEAFEDTQTAEDHALAARLGWVRIPEGGLPAPELAVRPGELIQIRRPGRKSSRIEWVPGEQHHATTDSARSTAPSSTSSSSAEERSTLGDSAR